MIDDELYKEALQHHFSAVLGTVSGKFILAHIMGICQVDIVPLSDSVEYTASVLGKHAVWKRIVEDMDDFQAYLDILKLYNEATT